MRQLAIDVSNLQGLIDWPAVAAAVIDGARIATVFIKATEGVGYTDRFFRDNWTRAGLAGLHRIAYHFGRPYDNTGAAEANYFLGTFDLVELGPDDSYALDQEDDGPNNSRLYDDLRAHDIDFLQTVDRTLGFVGYYYSRTEFMQRHNLVGSFDLARHRLWLASPGDLSPSVPRAWDRISAWQFGQGNCPGIVGVVDFDYVDD